LLLCNLSLGVIPYFFFAQGCGSLVCGETSGHHSVP
jgi:hypothetical protein